MIKQIPENIKQTLKDIKNMCIDKGFCTNCELESFCSENLFSFGKKTVPQHWEIEG